LFCLANPGPKASGAAMRRARVLRPDAILKIAAAETSRFSTRRQSHHRPGVNAFVDYPGDGTALPTALRHCRDIICVRLACRQRLYQHAIKPKTCIAFREDAS